MLDELACVTVLCCRRTVRCYYKALDCHCIAVLGGGHRGRGSSWVRSFVGIAEFWWVRLWWPEVLLRYLPVRGSMHDQMMVMVMVMRLGCRLQWLCWSMDGQHRRHASKRL